MRSSQTRRRIVPQILAGELPATIKAPDSATLKRRATAWLRERGLLLSWRRRKS